MKKYLAMPPRRTVILMLAIIAVGVIASVVLFGCAGLPVQDEAGQDVLPYFVPGTDMQMFTASPAGTPDTAPTLLDIGLKIAAAVTGTSGVLSLLSKNGRKAGAVVADPQAGVVESIKALGHMLTFGAVPPPAAAKET